MQARLALLISFGAVAAMAGCGGDNAFRAQFPNFERSHTLYAMNGSFPTLPSALSLRLNTASRIDPNWTFDIAFDLDDTNGVRVYSTRAVAGELTSVNRVGMQFAATTFDDVTLAPTGGYKYDTTMAVPIGRTLLIDVIDGTCSGFSFLGFNIRGKVVVDSIDATQRAIYVRLLSNPNCGFRALTEGLPKE